MRGRLLSLIPGLAVLVVCSVARASPFYPQTVADHLMISCVPPCTICHRDLSGGIGTVNKKFGMDMQALGLVFQNGPSLIAALDQAQKMGLDSDGDGDTDIDALKACRDPNQPASGGGVAPPEYGCALERAPNDRATLVAGLLGMSSVLAAARRRRRARS